MTLSIKEFKALQVSFDIFTYLKKYQKVFCEGMEIRDKHFSNSYDMVLTIYTVIREQDIELEEVRIFLEDRRDELIEDLQVGTDGLNCTDELYLISCILHRIELLNRSEIPTSKLRHPF